jgi:dienelactone hydrolase
MRLSGKWVVLLVAAAALSAQDTTSRALPPFSIPATVEVRNVDIYSEGTRMAGQVYIDKKNKGQKLPTLILAQGWGGTMLSLEREGVAFAEAGYLVLAFDYRGWGRSDSRLILTAKREPEEKKDFRFTAEVQEAREVVDPIDMVTDWENAIHWVVGEPECDVNRIGLWGTSLSGGLVASAAVNDPRVKAIHSQVPAFDGRWTLATAKERETTLTEATKRARGEMGLPKPRANTVGGLIGAPVRFQFAGWTPVEEIARVPKVAVQIILAEKDEVVDNKSNGQRAYDLTKGPKNLVIIPNIMHYGIYRDPTARFRARDLAIEWFDKYVKAAH